MSTQDVKELIDIITAEAELDAQILKRAREIIDRRLAYVSNSKIVTATAARVTPIPMIAGPSDPKLKIQCRFCPQKFRTKQGRSSHESKTHPDQWVPARNYKPTAVAKKNKRPKQEKRKYYGGGGKPSPLRNQIEMLIGSVPDGLTANEVSDLLHKQKIKYTGQAQIHNMLYSLKSSNRVTRSEDGKYVAITRSEVEEGEE